jgi:hypothetical protein
MNWLCLGDCFAALIAMDGMYAAVRRTGAFFCRNDFSFGLARKAIMEPLFRLFLRALCTLCAFAQTAVQNYEDNRFL